MNVSDQPHLIIPEMSQLMREVHALLAAAFCEHDLDFSKEQAIVLKFLMDQDGRPQNDLALVTQRDKTTLTRLLGKMEQNKLIRREQSASDKRVNQVFITEAGKAAFEQSMPLFRDVFVSAVQDIETEKLLIVQSVIEKIYKNLNLKNG